MSKRANLHAFPIDPRSDPDAERWSGLTIREYAAIAAMQGLLAGPRGASRDSVDTAEVARRCADALLAELEK